MRVLEVNLDHQVHKALVIIAGHRGVGPNNQVAIDPGGEVDVLADRKAQDVLGRREGKSEAPSVVADNLQRGRAAGPEPPHLTVWRRAAGAGAHSVGPCSCGPKEGHVAGQTKWSQRENVKQPKKFQDMAGRSHIDPKLELEGPRVTGATYDWTREEPGRDRCQARQ